MFNSIKTVRGLMAAGFVCSALMSNAVMADDDDVKLAIHPATVEIYMKSDIYQGNISGFDCVDSAGAAAACVFDASGYPTNAATIHWGYKGNVYAAVVNPATGVQRAPEMKIGTVEGAPAFPASFMALGDPSFGGNIQAVASAFGTETLPWTCTDCTLKISGSEFHRIPAIALTGRAFLGFGNVQNTENYLAMRMGGCAGVQEVSGKGKYANMMGTICLNGTIGFKPDFSGVGTSNCVMVLQQGPYNPVK